MTRPLIVANRHPAQRCYLMAASVWVFVWASMSGCGVVCRGPGCADEWDLGRLLVVRGAQGDADAVDAASGAWLGTVEQGNGWVVAAAGTTMWVGLPDVSSVAVVADGTADMALPAASITQGDTSAFGAALAVANGTDLWIGAPDLDFSQGGVYRVPGGADPVIRGAGPGDRLGDALATCGDLDGDGLQDLLVSAPWFAAPDGFPFADDVPALAGAVVLVLSAQEGVAVREPWTAGRLWWGATAGDALGAGMVCDRDLDGDGVVDIALGAPYFGAADDGAVYVISGAALPDSGPVDGAATRTVDGAAGSWLGTSLATLVPEGDPVAYLVAGAPGAEEGAGSAWILSNLDQPTPSRRAEIVADTAAAGSHVGREVATGDLDGDGTDDLLVGAPDWKEGKNGDAAGRLFAWHGAGGFLGTLDLGSADVVLTSTQPFSRIGRGVVAHDLDGDGADDVLLPTRTAEVRVSR